MGSGARIEDGLKLTANFQTDDGSQVLYESTSLGPWARGRRVAHFCARDNEMTPVLARAPSVICSVSRRRRRGDGPSTAHICTYDGDDIAAMR